MSTYSLLQLTFDQTISREDMENAADVLETLARPDIAKLHRELFGIVASGLRWDEANAFRMELEKYSYPTEVVADQEVPELPPISAIQRIVLREQELEFTNGMGRVQTRDLAELLFIGGGFLKQVEEKVSKVVRTNLSTRKHEPMRYIMRTTHMEDVPKFCFDFFFSTAPHRLQVLIIPENAAFYQGQLLRLRHPEQILTARNDFRGLLPVDRLTSGMLRDDMQTVYPTMASYVEEIRWRFHRLLKQRS